LSKFDAYIADIFDIIDATVVPSFVLQSQPLQHGHHSRCSFVSYDLRKIFFYVDVRAQVLLDVESFVFGLLSQASSQIPISAGDHCEVALLEVVELGEPSIQFLEDALDEEAGVDHGLRDAGELGAEGRELGVEGGFDVEVEHIEALACRQMYHDHRKLYDLWAWLRLLVLDAGGLEIQHQQVL
jgi:hypothetical protein